MKVQEHDKVEQIIEELQRLCYYDTPTVSEENMKTLLRRDHLSPGDLTEMVTRLAWRLQDVKFHQHIVQHELDVVRETKRGL